MIGERCGVTYVRLPSLTLSDYRALAWLAEMAAIGCVHENRSAWASQLRQQAAELRAQADWIGRKV